MSRYAEAHAKTNGAGDARPTALQIVQDEDLVGKLSDKVFVVTGVSSGIGIETARALYATGAHVFGTVRNLPKGQVVVDDIKSTTKGGQITLVEMDLESLASVKKGAQAILQQTQTLNLIINNAGVMATPQGRTKDNFETQFGTCHIAHFYLFQLLKPLLIASATPAFPSRLVSVSSIGHRSGPVRFDDYNFDEPDSYHPWKAYGQAKTANIYLANEIERRYGASPDHPLHATSLHPGGIATGLQVHTQEMMAQAAKKPAAVAYMKSPAQGAATSVYAALSKEWANKGGRYLSDCVEQPAYKGSGGMDLSDDGYATWAYDEEAAKRLWKDSLGMVGLEDDE